MANFSGYLIKFGNTILPNRYIQLNTYQLIPNQRTELSAYRDQNNLLHRITSPNYKTTLKFQTVPLSLSDKIALQNQMSAGIINYAERKYQITYWNDESNSYITGEFYLPDVTYPIKKITSNDIRYSPISFEFIEY